MRRLTLIPLLALTVLAWAYPAEAKEITSFTACGASGCKAEPRALLLKVTRMVELQGRTESVRTPTPAPYFRLEFGVDHQTGGPVFTQFYVPAYGEVALQIDPDAWTWVRAGRLRPLYELMTAGVTPFGTPTFTRASVAGKPAPDPAGYARLFALRGSTDYMPEEPDWLPIELGAARPTPWTTNAATLEYSPSKKVLWRGAEFIKLPAALAERLQARRSLRDGSSSGRGFASLPLVAGLGGGAVVLAAVGRSYWRRRSDPGTELHI